MVMILEYVLIFNTLLALIILAKEETFTKQELYYLVVYDE